MYPVKNGEHFFPPCFLLVSAEKVYTAQLLCAACDCTAADSQFLSTQSFKVEEDEFSQHEYKHGFLNHIKLKILHFL